jgi:hypothetical protein
LTEKVRLGSELQMTGNAPIGSDPLVSQALAEIVCIAVKHPQVQDMVTRRLRDILAQVDHEADTRKRVPRFRRCLAYQEICVKLKPTGFMSMPVKDFRHLVHKVFVQMGIPDDPPTNLVCELYLKLDKHWQKVRPVILAVVDEWIGAQAKH